MSLKMKLVSMISAFVLVIGMLLIGVFAVERVQVDMGGSITFNADDVYARVTGSVADAQVAPAGLDVTYSAYETTGNPTAWESLDLEFDSQATPIVISITVENLSTERSLTVNLTDALASSVPNLGKELKRDNGTYTSGTNITLNPKDNGTSTTTFTITLSVTDKNQSLTNAQFDYDLNLFDENYKFPYNYFDFRDNGDGTVTLTDYYPYLSDSTDIVIPSTVSQNADGQWMDGDDYIVTAIADGGYTSGVFYNSGITSIELPSTLESIGDYAFASCSSLTGELNLEECTSLTSIGNFAFEGCSGLESITLPDSLTSIGNSAFFNCDNLQPSTTDQGVKYLGSEQNPYLVLWNGKGITSSSYIVNENCKFIHSDAFSYCSGLTSITLPESLTSIGDYAFYNCSGLTGEFNLGECTSLTSIGNFAFEGCSGLTGEFNLGECTSLTSIGEFAFEGCSGLESITLPDSLTSIGNFAFYYCSGLTSITLPESLTSIGGGAFSNCRSLTSVRFKNTEGWQVSKSSDMSGAISVDVTDDSVNASNLRGKYYDYYWKRG